MRFWDSSAIVPLLVQQPDSARVDDWLAQDRTTAVWTLTPAELASAVWRLARADALPDKDARAAEARADEFVAASHVIVDVESAKAIARRLLRMHALTAADPMQLAAAIVWAGGSPPGKTLHTLDKRLAVAARREGFDVP